MWGVRVGVKEGHELFEVFENPKQIPLIRPFLNCRGATSGLDPKPLRTPICEIVSPNARQLIERL